MARSNSILPDPLEIVGSRETARVRQDYATKYDLFVIRYNSAGLSTKGGTWILDSSPRPEVPFHTSPKRLFRLRRASGAFIISYRVDSFIDLKEG